MNMDVDLDGHELELVDIEAKQMEDLTAMRMRPHLLPYRRFIHIGEVSFAADTKAKLAAGVSRPLYLSINVPRNLTLSDRVYRSR